MDLAKLVEPSLDLIRKANPKKEIHHELRIIPSKNVGPVLWTKVLADDLLEEVFVNLYSNSVKHSKKDEVFIQTLIERVEEIEKNLSEQKYSDTKKVSWKISIIDDSEGIRDEFKKIIF